MASVPPSQVSRAREAFALAQGGQGARAVALLEAAKDDADAQFLLGLWRIEGRLVPRDLGEAHARIAAAAGKAHVGAARVLQALIATGTGCPADWEAAISMLRDWAERDPLAARQLALIETMPATVPEAEPLSDRPYAARLPGLFTPAECAFLAELAAAKFKPAQIFHEGKGAWTRDPLRDSDSAAFPVIAQSPFVHALNRRIAAATDTDVRQGETLQVLRYASGQQYHPHFDAVPGLANQRVLTVLVWLNDSFEGGETEFPETGLTFRGALGDALIFANALPDGRADPATRHCGKPVTKGTKLIASRWIRAEPAPPGTEFGHGEAGRAG